MSGGDSSNVNLDYKLSAVIYAHTSDLRDIDVTEDGVIVTVSRDKTAKSWRNDNGQYVLHNTYLGHTNYVSSVLVMRPSTDYPNGLILTGSMDKTICGYKPEEPNPVFILNEHTDAVCCLSSSISGGFISGSWDRTAKLWDPGRRVSEITYEGHTLAVWCVLQMPCGMVLTGSADKLIRVFMPTGEFISTLLGHNDCVRDLSYLRGSEFLSCSNDGSVRYWEAISGTCLCVYDCHPSYVYSLSTSYDKNIVASSGEDNFIHIRRGKHTANLLLPCQSVWTIKFLPNNDLVTGGSDGAIRIFTTEPSRFASEDELRIFKETVQTKLGEKKHLGGSEIHEFSNPEALNQPGTCNGETKFVQEGECVYYYQWSERLSRWEQTGAVTGGASSPKQLYNGKEYDFVFDVNIDDHLPPLKLPYNRNEDPREAARNFLTAHNLNVSFYLDIVTDFITQRRALPYTTPDSDPLTGGARYVPIPGSSNSQNQVINPVMPDEEQQQKHFPPRFFLRFDIGDPEVIFNKVLEFNTETGTVYDPEVLKRLEVFAKPQMGVSNVDEEEVEILKGLYSWPKNMLFPVLDVTRLAVREQALNGMICSNGNGNFFINVCIELLREDSEMSCHITVLRLLTNMFLHTPGEVLVMRNKHAIRERMLRLVKKFANKHIQLGVSTLLLNMMIAQKKRDFDTEEDISLQHMYVKTLVDLEDLEAKYRVLVAIGTRASGIPKLEMTPDLVNLLLEIGSDKTLPPRLCICAGDILNLM